MSQVTRQREGLPGAARLPQVSAGCVDIVGVRSPATGYACTCPNGKHEAHDDETNSCPSTNQRGVGGALPVARACCSGCRHSEPNARQTMSGRQRANAARDG